MSPTLQISKNFDLICKDYLRLNYIVSVICIEQEKKIIEDMVLPNSYILQAGGIMKGYVVFVGKTPNYGQAIIYVPLFESKDVVLHRFKFAFDF